MVAPCRSIVCRLIAGLVSVQLIAAPAGRAWAGRNRFPAARTGEMEGPRHDPTALQLAPHLHASHRPEQFAGWETPADRALFRQGQVLLAARNLAMRQTLQVLDQLYALQSAVLANRNEAGSRPLSEVENRQAEEIDNFRLRYPFELQRRVPDLTWRYYPTVLLWRDQARRSSAVADPQAGASFIRTVVENALALFKMEIEELVLQERRREIIKVDRDEQVRNGEEGIIEYPGGAHGYRRVYQERGDSLEVVTLENRLREIESLKRIAQNFQRYLYIPVYAKWAKIDPLLAFGKKLQPKYYLYHLITAEYLMSIPGALAYWPIDPSDAAKSAEKLAWAYQKYAAAVHYRRGLPNSLQPLPTAFTFLERVMPEGYQQLAPAISHYQEPFEPSQVGEGILEHFERRVSLTLAEMLQGLMERYLDQLEQFSRAQFIGPLLPARTATQEDQLLAGYGPSRMRETIAALLYLTVSEELLDMVWQEFERAGAMPKVVFDDAVRELRRQWEMKRDKASESDLVLIGTAVGLISLVLFVAGLGPLALILGSLSMAIILADGIYRREEMKPYYNWVRVGYNDFGSFFPPLLRLPLVSAEERDRGIALDDSQYASLYSLAFWLAVDSLVACGRLYRLAKGVHQGVLVLDKGKFVSFFREMTPSLTKLRQLTAGGLGRKVFGHGRLILATFLLVYFYNAGLLSAKTFNQEEVAAEYLLQKRGGTERAVAKAEVGRAAEQKLRQLQAVLQAGDEKSGEAYFRDFYRRQAEVTNTFHSPIILYDLKQPEIVRGQLFLSYDWFMNTPLPEVAETVGRYYYKTTLVPALVLDRVLAKSRQEDFSLYFGEAFPESEQRREELAKLQQLQQLVQRELGQVDRQKLDKEAQVFAAVYRQIAELSLKRK